MMQYFLHEFVKLIFHTLLFESFFAVADAEYQSAKSLDAHLAKFEILTCGFVCAFLCRFFSFILLPIRRCLQIGGNLAISSHLKDIRNLNNIMLFVYFIRLYWFMPIFFSLLYSLLSHLPYNDKKIY